MFKPVGALSEHDIVFFSLDNYPRKVFHLQSTRRLNKPSRTQKAVIHIIISNLLAINVFMSGNARFPI